MSLARRMRRAATKATAPHASPKRPPAPPLPVAHNAHAVSAQFPAAHNTPIPYLQWCDQPGGDFSFDPPVSAAIKTAHQASYAQAIEHIKADGVGSSRVAYCVTGNTSGGMEELLVLHAQGWVDDEEVPDDEDSDVERCDGFCGEVWTCEYADVGADDPFSTLDEIPEEYHALQFVLTTYDDIESLRHAAGIKALLMLNGASKKEANSQVGAWRGAFNAHLTR